MLVLCAGDFLAPRVASGVAADKVAETKMLQLLMRKATLLLHLDYPVGSRNLRNPCPVSASSLLSLQMPGNVKLNCASHSTWSGTVEACKSP